MSESFLFTASEDVLLLFQITDPIFKLFPTRPNRGTSEAPLLVFLGGIVLIQFALDFLKKVFELYLSMQNSTSSKDNINHLD